VSDQLIKEELLAVDQLLKAHPVLAKIGRHTVRNWMNHGSLVPAGRVYLEGIRIGRNLFSSVAAVNRFLVACNQKKEKADAGK
jgi:hypothetical protein